MNELLLRYNFKQKYLCWDAETCNLALQKGTSNHILNVPWQWGWSVCTSKETLEEHEDWLSWPFDIPIGAKAARITRFNWDEYNRRKKPAEPILDNFEKYLYDPSVLNVTANGSRFDCMIHNIYRQLLNRPTDYSYLRRHIDIQVLHKAIVLELTPPPIGGIDWLSFSFKVSDYHRKGLKSSLAHMCGYYDVPYIPERHHVEAGYDVFLTFEILKKQLYKLEI